jgi:hypothetical protein
MLKTICSAIGILILFSSSVWGQEELFGKIMIQGSPQPVSGVNVSNLSQKKHNLSDLGGNYKIQAGIGDTLIFSSAGFISDTLVVRISELEDHIQVFLIPNVVKLPSVEVDEMAIYRADSVKRREEYAIILDKKHPVKLFNEKRTGDNPGLSFSPIGYYSSGESQKRRLKKRLKQEEQDYFIDYKFSLARIGQLTRLRGDSLKIFMVRFRPGYSFCRNANTLDILLYVNDKLKVFRKIN